MKILAYIILLVLGLASVGHSQHAPYPAPKIRSADSIRSVFICSWGPFDHWPRDSAHTRFSLDLNDAAINGLRYVNLPADLGLNAEHRRYIWSYPSNQPAPKDTVLGGDHEHLDDVLILEPVSLFDILECSSYMRFDFERHTLRDPASEYPGFFDHDTSHGAVKLVGVNSSDTTAASCFWIKGTAVSGDQSNTCVKLVAHVDSLGIFDDSLWHPHFINSKASPVQYFREDFGNRRLLVRSRIRIDQVQDTGLKAPLFVMHTKMVQEDSSIVSRNDTFKVDGNFKHVDSLFDTVGVRFFCPLHTLQMFFSFEWLGTISMTADWLEVMTAHVNTTDTSTAVYDSLHLKNYANVSAGEAAAYSAEDVLASPCPALDTLLKTQIDQYIGHCNFFRIGDEFRLAQALPYQRLVQRIRVLSGRQIELTEFTQDSSSYIFGIGIPDQQSFMFEGVQQGLLDDSTFADPKMVIYDVNDFDNSSPLPKRTKGLTDSAVLAWEKTFASTDNLNLLAGDGSATSHYTRDRYLTNMQLNHYPHYLLENREARRLTERNKPGMHYALTWASGVGIGKKKVGSDSTLIYGGTLRQITGAEMKVTGHIALSCGARGLELYLLDSPPDTVDGANGGIVNDRGFHDTNYFNSLIHPFSHPFWMGWKERYDSVKSVIPTLIAYGATLIDDNCMGDWTARELMDDSTVPLPFVVSSIRTYNDSLIQDPYTKRISDSISYRDTVFYDSTCDCGVLDTIPTLFPFNRTFVHVSMWLDTNAAAKSAGSDTLLYITNMRTDDSYDTTEVPTTIDRRLITFRMKRPHVIMDVLDTNGGQLDDGRIWTPYVGTDAGDSLKIYLNAGDGILVRLLNLDTAVANKMRQTRVAMTFPKGTSDFNDKGRIKFDRPIPGVRNKTSDWSIPSSSKPYIVGIQDTTTAKLWQDSLVYQRVDSVKNSRAGQWRHQHWATGSNVRFGFKDSLSHASTSRQPEIGTDSVAHNIVIKTDLEGQSSNGKIKVRDPFLVDSATLSNVYDTLAKGSPFLPHVLSSGRMPGADSEHYGGIFLRQNPSRLTTVPPIPMYSISAYSVIKSGTFQSLDTIPAPGDWSFLNWHTDDNYSLSDPSPWIYDTTGLAMDVIFIRDSAQYSARYKAHMAAFSGSSDPGFAMNNQRKLYYIYTDPSGKRWYRIVYASAGRIFTTTGYRTGTGDADFFWKPEQLISEWTDPSAEYPAEGMHRDIYDTLFHYV